MITKRDVILRGSCFCEKHSSIGPKSAHSFQRCLYEIYISFEFCCFWYDNYKDPGRAYMLRSKVRFISTIVPVQVDKNARLIS